MKHFKKFISKNEADRNYQSLCKKARDLSSLAKIKNCISLYLEKNRVISHIIENFPENVFIKKTDRKYWFIHLSGFGGIHVSIEKLSEKAQRHLEIDLMYLKEGKCA